MKIFLALGCGAIGNSTSPANIALVAGTTGDSAGLWWTVFVLPGLGGIILPLTGYLYRDNDDEKQKV